jgi:hypothetical protein
MAIDPASLVARLAQLRELDPEQQLFGALMHRYQLNAPLAADDVARFEAEARVRLPAEYRAFLLDAGDGGAGPVYGLKPLRTEERYFTRNRRDGAPAADPARAFRLPDALPDDASPYDGCLELAEIGCGYFYFLVVTGERAGEVWQDYTAGDGQIAATGKSFFEWYDAWLDDGLAERAAERMVLALKRGDPRAPSIELHVPLIEKQSLAQPRWATAHLRMAFARGYTDDFTQAEIHLHRALELEPRLKLDVALARVVLRWKQGRFAEAVDEATAAIGAPEFHYAIKKELHLVRTIALERLGRLDDACAAAAERTAFDQKDLGAWLDEARLHAIAGDRARAAETLRAGAAANSDGQDVESITRSGYRALADRLTGEGRAEDGAHFAALC